MNEFISMDKELIKQILTEQRKYFLLKNVGTERNILKDIAQKIALPSIIIITGIRRCGKSTLLRQIVEKYFTNGNFYYINFEDERLYNFEAAEFNAIYEAQLELFGAQKTFFIDEIQNIDKFENFVRRFYENGFKFIITGSNSRLLSHELGTKLTARYVDINLVPFDFDEFLRLRNFSFDMQDIYISERRAIIKNHFSDYLNLGGMPEYLIYNDETFIAKAYEDIVIKDIAVRHNIENVTNLRELYRFLITNFSNRYSYQSLLKIVDIGSVNTVKKFIGYLSDAFVVSEVCRFDYSLKKQLVNEKKIYVSDNGFINRISMRFTKDTGRLLENLVFNKLKTKYSVYYYHLNLECDFIAALDNKIMFAIQVCSELNEQNRLREINGLTQAAQILKIERAYILTHDTEEVIGTETINIEVMPVWKWLII